MVHIKQKQSMEDDGHFEPMRQSAADLKCYQKEMKSQIYDFKSFSLCRVEKVV